MGVPCKRGYRNAYRNFTVNGNTTAILIKLRSVRGKLRVSLNLSIPCCPAKQVLISRSSRRKQEGKGEAALPQREDTRSVADVRERR